MHPSRLSELLGLAAAPAFALMALLTMRTPHPLCGGSALTGMMPMYLMMCIVHLAPWLRLLTPCAPRC